MIILRSQVAGSSAGALERFARRALRAVGLRGEVDVLVTGNAEVRRLNRRFRGQDEATDVLSFPAADGDAGDIAISAPVAVANARRLGHSVADELKILILHGLLHLAGYDREHDRGEMARREARLRQALGLPASLLERGHGAALRAQPARKPRQRRSP